MECNIVLPPADDDLAVVVQTNDNLILRPAKASSVGVRKKGGSGIPKEYILVIVLAEDDDGILTQWVLSSSRRKTA